MPRSGTTLLSAMLASHPHMAIAPETHFLSYWVVRFRRLDVRREKDFHCFWNHFSPGLHFQGLGLDADASRRRILLLAEHDYQDIFSALLRMYAEERGKARWGEKTPTHYLYLDALLRWFPRARILYVVRDPRAVVASRLRMPWRPRGVDDVAGQWRDSIRILDAWGDDGRVHEVRYEALVRAPEPTLRDVCEFLDEEYIPVMLEYTEAARPLIAGKPWNDDALQSPNRTNIDRWTSQLSPHDVAMIEYLAGKEMAGHGYELNGTSLSLSQILGILTRRGIRALRRRLPGKETGLL
jgi:hypothetical protein